MILDHEFSDLDIRYLQHFATELGRWLDCTDPKRQFTLKIPQLIRKERILLLAVTCFAARHLKDSTKAAEAHEETVKLLIPRLDATDVAADDALLCAIVILRVYEQLDGTSFPGANQHANVWQYRTQGVIMSDIWPGALRY